MFYLMARISSAAAAIAAWASVKVMTTRRTFIVSCYAALIAERARSLERDAFLVVRSASLKIAAAGSSLS